MDILTLMEVAIALAAIVLLVPTVIYFVLSMRSKTDESRAKNLVYSAFCLVVAILVRLVLPI